MSAGRVLFVVFDEPGHVHPTFRLAKMLRARGHSITYAALHPPAGSASMSDEVRAQGFTFCHFSALFEGAPGRDLRQYGRLTSRADARRWMEALRRWMSATIIHDRPDVCVVDIILPLLALPLHKAGLPTVMFSTSLSTGKHDGLPPLSSALQPGRSALFALRSATAWWRLAARRRVDTLVAKKHDAFPTYDVCERAMRELAPMAGIPIASIHFEALFLPLLDRPTLVVAPAELEFPGAVPRGAIHLGPCIDLERSEPAFPFERLDASKRMVLSTFGSQTQLYPDLGNFVERLAAAAARLPNHQLVIAAGSHAERVRPSALPSNVILLAKVPQLALLVRASVMLTHGGLSSIKEALWFDVPLIIDPRVGDQRGNAARIACRGAGVVLPSRTASPSELAALIARVDGDSAMRAAVAALGARIRASDSSLEDGARAIEDARSARP